MVYAQPDCKTDMMLRSLKITDLPFLQEQLSVRNCIGGYTQANTSTWTSPGLAAANATATAIGQYTYTGGWTNTFVRDKGPLSVSQASAFAVAVAVTGTKIESSVSSSFSMSINFGR